MELGFTGRTVQPPTPRQLYIIIFATIILSVSAVLFSSVYTELLPIPLALSLSAIFLSAVGTFITLIPSIYLKLGITSEFEEWEKFSQEMKKALSTLSNDRSLREGDPGYDAMYLYLKECYDIEEEPEQITINADSRLPLKPTSLIALQMKGIDDRWEDHRKRMADIRERRFVIAGASLYAAAIIFQSITTFVGYI